MFKKTALLALIAGASFTVGGSAIFAEEVEQKSYEEWVEIYKAEHAAALKKHPDLDFIERGAAMWCYSKHGAPTQYFDPNKKPDTSAFTKIGMSYYNAFMEFYNSSEGKAMLEKYKKEGVLSPENQAYFWVVQATVDGYHTKKGIINEKSTKEQIATFKMDGAFATRFAERAYKQELFTRKEMDTFRKYTAALPKGHTCPHWPSAKFERWSKEDLNKIFTSKIILTGEKMPDMKFHYYKNEAERRGYTHDKYEYSLHAYITPLALESYMPCISKFKYVKKDGNEFLSPDYSDFEGLDKEDYFDLSSETKKGRPISFIHHMVYDTGDYVREIGYQEALFWLFKDDVDFYHVTRLDSMFGFCEYFIRKDVFSGLWKGKAIKEGYKSTENFISADKGEISSVPKGFLRLPTKSVPIILNLGARERELAWGIPNYFIDKNGIQCESVNQKGRLYMTGLGTKHDGGYSRELPYDNRDREWILIAQYRLKKAIRFFKVMETLNWEYDANSELPKDYYKDIEDTSHQEISRYRMKKAVVVKVDMEKKEIHIKGQAKYGYGSRANVEEEDTVHIIHFGDRPRIISNQKRAHDMTTLKAGDVVNLRYRLKTNTIDYKILQAIAKGDDNHAYGELGYTEGIFLNGKVTAINLEKAQLTVVMPKPDASKGEWKAFDLFEKELKPLGMAEPTDNLVKGWSFCKKLYYGTEADRTFTIHMDDAVYFSVNGRETKLNKVSIGDKIVFSVATRSNLTNGQQVYPDTVCVVKDGPLTGDELVFKAGE